MKKSFLISLGVLAAVVAAAAMFRKPHDIDVSKEYAADFGRRFETKQGLIVYQFGDSKDLSLQEFEGGMPKPEDFTKKLPFRWSGDWVYGVLPAGSRFRIVGAMRSTSFTMGHDWYMVEIESEGPFKGKIIGTSSLQIGASAGSLYDPALVVELAIPTKK